MSSESTAINESVRLLATYIHNNASILERYKETMSPLDRKIYEDTRLARFFVRDYYGTVNEKSDDPNTSVEKTIVLARSYLSLLAASVEAIQTI